jgi:Na+/serine symporter
LPVADIELNEIEPDVLLFVNLTVETPLLLPTVTVPKSILVGATVNMANACVDVSVSSRNKVNRDDFDISLAGIVAMV